MPNHTCSTCGSSKSGREAYCSAECRPECSVPGCPAPIRGRSVVCELHRSRRRDGLPDWRTCSACGVDIEDRPKKSKVCDAHDVCVVDTCSRKILSNSLCGKHYKHNRVYGKPFSQCRTCGNPIDLGPGQHAYCSARCRPKCIVEGCDYVARGGSEICAGHQVQLRKDGALRPTNAWSRDWVCVVCGADVEKGSGRRKHCSNACQALDSAHRGGRPKSLSCASCGDDINLMEPGTGRTNRRRSDTKLCGRCRKRKRYGTTVYALALRDGTLCSICGDEVDMDNPGLMKPSIDHVLPRSRGGTDDPGNLALAHLICNIRKNNKVA